MCISFVVKTKQKNIQWEKGFQSNAVDSFYAPRQASNAIYFESILLTLPI